ncbi:MAG: hypothetical protein WDO74_22260 [Pseudomonadota bacterium]
MIPTKVDEQMETNDDAAIKALRARRAALGTPGDDEPYSLEEVDFAEKFLRRHERKPPAGRVEVIAFTNVSPPETE